MGTKIDDRNAPRLLRRRETTFGESPHVTVVLKQPLMRPVGIPSAGSTLCATDATPFYWTPEGGPELTVDVIGRDDGRHLVLRTKAWPIQSREDIADLHKALCDLFDSRLEDE